jgi:hypothetical protein
MVSGKLNLLLASPMGDSPPNLPAWATECFHQNSLPMLIATWLMVDGGNRSRYRTRNRTR